LITVDLDRLQIKPHQRVLDIGCGSGRHACHAYRLPDVRIVGADRNLTELCEAARRLELHDRLGEHGGGIWALTAADVLHLPFQSGTFDGVICSEVLEHVRDHRTAASEILRVCKPGGILAVSVPRRWPEWICWRISPEYTRTAGGHIRIYHRRQLCALLWAAGASGPYLAHYSHALHTPFWWLKCLMGLSRNPLPVALYHRFLTWDILARPRVTRVLESLLNPLLGKSLVLYFRKPSPP
jgi:SAM-dependent methyltransferase